MELCLGVLTRGSEGLHGHFPSKDQMLQGRSRALLHLLNHSSLFSSKPGETATPRGEICKMPSTNTMWEILSENQKTAQKSLIKKKCKCPTNLRYWDKVLSLTASASEPLFNALKAQEHFITPQNNTVFYVRKRCSGNLPWKLPANIHFLAALCIWRGLLFSLKKK